MRKPAPPRSLCASTSMVPWFFSTKVAVLWFLMIWFRWTWPRLREDQLQTLAWRWLIPLALVNIVVIATFKALM